MKSVLYSTSMALALAAIVPDRAPAQVPGGAPRGPAPTPVADPLNRPFLPVPRGQAPASTPLPPSGDSESDAQVFQNGAVLPAPVDPGQVAPPAFLPTEPLEPYLLTRQAGPFLVAAHIFRGDYAVQRAQALAMELRAEHRMPAFVYFLKMKPGNSNIRDVPPTAPREVDQPYLGPPESDRVTDEAVVLVGHFPSIEAAKEMWHRVKKLRPRTLADHTSIFPWRNGKGLDRAFITSNPLIPSQDLYPGRPADHSKVPALPAGAVVDPEVLRSQFVSRPDPLVVRMNSGTPHSIYKCPAPYTLVVAEFSGRSALRSQGDRSVVPARVPKDSPLWTAHEDAMTLAAALAKHEVVRSLGVQPYVYHDLTSSRVMLGAFGTPDDPKIDQIRRAAATIEVETGRGRDKEGNYVITRKHLAPGGSAFEVPRPE